MALHAGSLAKEAEVLSAKWIPRKAAKGQLNSEWT